MIVCLLLLSALPALVMATNPCPIRTTAELRDFRCGEKPELRILDITAHVTCRQEETTIVEDATGRAELTYGRKDVSPGDFVRFRGVSQLNNRLLPWDYVDAATVLDKRELPAPLVTRIDRLDTHRDDLRQVVAEGVVVASFDDEIDARYRILIIKDGRTTMPVYVLRERFPDNLRETGARIRTAGVFYRCVGGMRHFPQPAILCDRVEVLNPPPADPFDVPELKGRTMLTVDEIAALGRRKVVGKVLAAWDGSRLMLKAGRHKVYFARLQDGIALPPTDSFITLLGEADANLFNITLENALWKPAAPADVGKDGPPTDIVPHDVFRETPAGQKNIQVSYQGSLVRLSGTLLTLPSPDRDGQRLTVGCDQYVVPVDVSAVPDGAKDLPVGAKLRVTGRCLLESTKKTSYDIFPQITGFTVIARSPADIEVLSRPSWWTPARLVGVIATLLAALLAVVVWNRFLNRLVQRRGRELSRAEVAKVSSELRVGERTRLAVELHDTLSQNLTGIALAINAGAYALAEKSLKSCREELKNCLWDLRNDALEDADMNEAIRKTLAPHVGAAKLVVRFQLARNTLTDNTAHAILRIVRELAVNAVRHGGASEIRVAGSVEAQRILFSVRDNGKGFDPLRAPGMEEGHFGLQGIRDRIKHLSGEMKIESSPTTGTKVSIWLKSKC